ncbi:Protein kinase domain [Phytophthora infestans]|uniref:Casein kinase I n=1 Tax=Phytophthora infestans TaxID=4787 RepID=A0A833SUE5_PHYIN|nr:Protein kinase domain [Phytophthora infestans]
MEGTTLKSWRLGKKLGSGACSDVYAVEPMSPLSRDAGQQERKKTPAERNADALYAEHLLYKNHLRDQPGIPYVPMGAYGEDKGYRFLVIERLGRTLETVLQEQGPVSSATAARLGQEILETLQQMHVKNILYVDVKPENFMLDMRSENTVYCVDFGISDRYVTATGKHKEYKEGTVLEKRESLTFVLSSASSRRDDIESLLYVLVYLMRGNLPWQKASSDAEGAKIKKSTSVEQLCASLPNAWGAMLKNIRYCGFEDRPDYDFFVMQLSKLGGSKGLSTPFEWGTRKTSKAAAKVAAATQESATDSPVRKRVKSADEVPTVPPPTAAKTEKINAPEKKKATPRHSKAPTKKAAAPFPKGSNASKKDQQAADKDGVEVECTSDVRPQDREVFKAIAGHAAATAAVKRYNLRSAR